MDLVKVSRNSTDPYHFYLSALHNFTYSYLKYKAVKKKNKTKQKKPQLVEAQ